MAREMSEKPKENRVTFKNGQVTLPDNDGPGASSLAQSSVALKSEVEGDERGSWGGKFEFMLTMISYAVGLGNVWRFPYLCYRNGGGAFLFPYIIMLAVVGLPIFYMEMAFGQFASLGPLTIWKVSPLFKGVGVAMMTTSAMVSVYYTVIIAWTIFYFFASMQSEVPWKTCEDANHTALDWVRGQCQMREIQHTITNVTNSTNTSTTPTPSNNPSSEIWGPRNISLQFNVTTPPEHYFYDRVLNISPGLDEIGFPQWELMLCLMLAWILIAVALIKGVESLGKVSYFTAVFPYIFLTALMIKGLMLEGAIDGVIYYLEPQWHRLSEPRVWADAAVQIFYSLSVCSGGLITMSSYNDFSNNCYRDSVIVAIINCATSIYAGIAIFAILGYMSFVTGLPIDKVATQGPGLVFIVYPEGLATLPGATVWSILFFFMMFTLGMGSSLSMMENVLSSVLDEFPVLRKTKLRNAFSRAAICFIFFLLGLPMVCQGGMYLLTIVDLSAGNFPLLFIALTELIVLNWVYGYDEFAEDLELMLGHKPNLYWKICWKYVSPLIIIAVIVFSIIEYTDITYDAYQYPSHYLNMGYLIQAAPILAIPFGAMRLYCVKSGMWGQVVEMTQPEGDWGPTKRENRKGKYSEDDPQFQIEDDYDVEEDERRVRASSQASGRHTGASPPPRRTPNTPQHADSGFDSIGRGGYDNRGANLSDKERF